LFANRITSAISSVDPDSDRADVESKCQGEERLAAGRQTGGGAKGTDDAEHPAHDEDRRGQLDGGRPGRCGRPLVVGSRRQVADERPAIRTGALAVSLSHRRGR
jgi:hypothetical protein